MAMMDKTDLEKDLLANKILALENVIARQEFELSFQRQSFWTLVTVAELTLDSVSVNDVFKIAIENIWEITGFSYVGMRKFVEEYKAYKLIAQKGMSPEMEEDLEWLPADTDYVAEASIMKRAVINPLKDNASLKLGYRNMICVPLMGADHTVGIMELVSKEENVKSRGEIQWLLFIGRFIGLLIQFKELSQELKRQAVQTERIHLAQEIHDGLVQSLNSLFVWAEEASMSLAEGDTKAVLSAVENIKQISNETNKTLRDELMGLRKEYKTDKPIIIELKELVSHFQHQWGIETHFVINKLSENQAEPHFSQTVGIQLLRIVQEALSNVRRHAKATKILISMENTNEWARFFIQDNGQGFELNRVTEDHLGIHIMRERAASVGGNVRISSGLKKGTKLVIEMPIKELNI
jgi:two-component system nitrate/nitrite sensor histidine kinase NarX